MSQILNGLPIFVLPFLAVFAIAFAIASTGSGYGKLTGLHEFLRSRRFSADISPDVEINRINLLRLITAAILLHRTTYILIYQLEMVPLSIETAVTCLVAVLGILLLLGLATPIAAFLLLIGMQYFDYITETTTLGTDVLNILLLVLAFLPAGTRVSIDSILLKGSGSLSNALKKIYRLFGEPTLQRASTLRFLALLSYGLICISSVFHHFTDPAWMEGYANVQILTSSYLSRDYDLFRYVFEHAPTIAIPLAEFSIYGMIVWELFFIPMILSNRFTRMLAIGWGLAFILVSTFILQLNWLPYYEYVLWALLFWQGAWLHSAKQSRFLIYYDDKCNLCDRTVRFVRSTDLFSAVTLLPLSRNLEKLTGRGISIDDAYKDLYGVDQRSDQLYAGYNLYLTLSWRVFALLPIFPILLLGKLVRLGPYLYRKIADHRIQLFGSCEIPADSGELLTKREHISVANFRANDRVLFTVALSYLILAIFFSFRIPLIKDLPVVDKLSGVSQLLAREAAQVFGMTQLNVFNYHDLRLSENFYTISRVNDDDSLTLLPFTGTDGQRLKWHQSDRVYFGISLPWRRSMIDWDKSCYQEQWIYRWDSELVRLDKTAPGGVATYQLDYYYQPLPDPDMIAEYKFYLPTRRPTCSVRIDADTSRILSIREQSVGLRTLNGKTDKVRE